MTPIEARWYVEPIGWVNVAIVAFVADAGRVLAVVVVTDPTMFGNIRAGVITQAGLDRLEVKAHRLDVVS